MPVGEGGLFLLQVRGVRIGVLVFSAGFFGVLSVLTIIQQVQRLFVATEVVFVDADNDAFSLGGRYNFANLSTLGAEMTTGMKVSSTCSTRSDAPSRRRRARAVAIATGLASTKIARRPK